VVAPRNVEIDQRLRALMPRCIFLVPGYGAQGATAEDIRHCFNDGGMGAMVNASRSVIYAFDNEKYKDQFSGNWEMCIEAACKVFTREVAQAAGL